MNEIQKPTFERKWAKCPHCGAKTILYDSTAECSGIFLKCTRNCKKEFELKITRGKQVH